MVVVGVTIIGSLPWRSVSKSVEKVRMSFWYKELTHNLFGVHCPPAFQYHLPLSHQRSPLQIGPLRPV